jgi:hypothetical protein
MPPLGVGRYVLAGLLVGMGTRLGGGCTSGHGICGLARLSKRSIVAVATFMAAGAVTVAALHALAALTAQLRVSGSQAMVPEEAIAAARRVLHRYLLPGNAPAVRRAAADACVVLAMAASTGEEAQQRCGQAANASPHALLSLLTEAATRAQAEHDPGVAALMLEADIDGGLVGGASIDPDEFVSVCRYRMHA